MKTMRLKRIFALFLALAVMSTVIVALPLTVSAAETINANGATELVAIADNYTNNSHQNDGITYSNKEGYLALDSKYPSGIFGDLTQITRNFGASRDTDTVTIDNISVAEGVDTLRVYVLSREYNDKTVSVTPDTGDAITNTMSSAPVYAKSGNSNLTINGFDIPVTSSTNKLTIEVGSTPLLGVAYYCGKAVNSGVVNVANGKFYGVKDPAGVSVANTARTGTITANTDCPAEYKEVFGNNFEKVGNQKLGYMGYWADRNGKPGTGTAKVNNYEITQPGSYKILVVAQGSSSNNVRFVLDNADTEENVIPATQPTRSSAVATDNKTDLHIYYLDVELQPGLYNFTFDLRERTGEETGDVKLPDVYAMAIVKQTFGIGGVDSGYYKENDQIDGAKSGVIRFMQGYDGKEATRYGFYVVNGGNGSITPGETTPVIENDVNSSSLNGSGFYADITDIPENDSNVYYALPFVGVDSEVEYGDTISGKVDWETWVEDPYPTTPAE